MQIPKLYKYRYFNNDTVSRTGLPDGEEITKWRQVLYDGLIFPSNPSEFNDPFDCDFLLGDSFWNSKALKLSLIEVISKKYLITTAEKVFLENADDIWHELENVLRKHYRIKHSQIAKIQQAVIKNASEIVKDIRERLRIACFSKTKDSVLMWSHYAQNHQGFCIEYDLNAWDGKGHLRDVRYVDEHNRHRIPSDFMDNAPPDAGAAIMEAALYKSNVWNYEQECRLVTVDYNMNVPFTLPLKDFITAVYLGSRTIPKYEQEICNHYKGTSIQIYRMKMRTDSYTLEPELIQ